jgi:hypothetical protein
MLSRFAAMATLVTAFGCAFGSLQDEPSKLPIDVPKHAVVSFEAEGTGKQIFTTVRRLLNGDLQDPTAPSMDKITINTGLGNIDLHVEDMEPVFDKIHQLHIVSYTALPNEDPFKHYEHQFTDAGLKRVALVPGQEGALIMRQNGPTDMYGVVLRHKDNILVLRSDGSPDIRAIGRTLFESLSKAVQQAVKDKHR